ncbi:MAG: M56 family metallopeptidase, partial [Planctomycetales bacterium]
HKPTATTRDFRLEPETNPRIVAAQGSTPPITLDRAAIPGTSPSRSPKSTSMTVGVLIATTWLLGTCVLAGFALRSVWKVNRVRRRACLPNTSRHMAIAEAAATTVGVRNRPVVLESRDVSAPVVIGFRCPAVLVPPGVFEIVSDDDLRDIFIHEFAHVRRRDQWVLCAQIAARCLFWPVLTIHWLNRELARSREEVCDNFVLAYQDAIAYGELLLRLDRLAIGPQPIGEMMGILNGEGELERRVVRILDPTTNRATASSNGTRWLLLAGFLLLGSLLCGTRFVAAQPPRKSAAKAKADAAKPAVASKSPSAPKRSTTDALGDPLPPGAHLRLGTVRFRPASIVAEMALSPDEKSIVTVGDRLIVWDAQTGQERWRAKAEEFGYMNSGPRYGSRLLSFSSVSQRFYTTGQQNQVVEWDTVSGAHEVLKIKAKKPGPMLQSNSSIDVTADGKRLAVGFPIGVCVCDRQGNVLYEISNTAKGPPKFNDNGDRLNFFGPYSFGRFSPDGTILTVVTSDRPAEVRLMDAESGRELRNIKLTSKMVRLAFSPDGQQLVATERDSAVRLYDVATGQPLWSQVIELNNPFENYASAVAFSPDGKTIAAGATDHRIYLFDPATGAETGRLIGHHAYPWVLAFSANNTMLYSSGWDGIIRRWDVPSRQQLPLPDGVHGSEVVAASPDGKTLAYQDDAGTIRIVAAEDGAERHKLEIPGMRFSQLLFSPDGRQLAGGGSSGDQVQVAVWDVESWQVVRTWNWPKGRDPHSHVEALSFSPDGGRLAAAVFRQSAAYVWEMATGQQVAQLAHKEIYGLSFSPDGETLASAGWDSIVRFWETGGWTARREFNVAEGAQQGEDLRMYAVSYAPEGGLIATAHMDGKVRVWQADDMRQRTEFGARLTYGALSFSPDGLWLATGAAAGQIQLWDSLTGKQVWGGGPHQFYAYTVGFGRDSRTLVSGGDDGVGYLWDLRPPGHDKPEDLMRLWDDLGGEDATTAYQATWALSEVPDRAVALLAEKLRPVHSVVDPDILLEGNSPEESARIKRLKKVLAEKDPKVELAITVRRAVSLLAQLGTPEARRLLEELAERDSQGDLGRFATAALHRFRIQKP